MSVEIDFSKHILEEYLRCTGCVMFSLKRPGTRCMSTLITFTPEGIVLQGDLTPSHFGNVSAIGYGEAWLRGNCSGSYLCEKFLTKRFVPEVFIKGVRDSQWQDDMEITKEQAESLASMADDGRQPCCIMDEARDIGIDEMECLPGYTYDPTEAEILIAIQKRFSDLHRQMYPNGLPETRVAEKP